MKKQLVTLSLCAALCLSMIACGNTVQPRDNADSPTTNQSQQIPNPWVDYNTLENAAKAAGFDITLPEKAADSDTVSFRAMEGEMLEIIYSANGDETARLRKSLGTDDISGDYNNYETTSTAATANGTEVTLKGNDDLVYVATWLDEDYTYSLSIKNGAASEEVLNIVSSIR